LTRKTLIIEKNGAKLIPNRHDLYLKTKTIKRKAIKLKAIKREFILK
jgi:hypothetical protein